MKDIVYFELNNWMPEMENYNTFTKELLHIDDVVVYLKNERTGSSTIRKCKFIGQVVDFTKTKVEIRRLSPPDTFVTPDEIQDLGVDTVCSDDVVYIIISKYLDDYYTRTLKRANSLVDKYEAELEFTRKFIHEQGLEFELASEWDKHLKNKL